MIEEMYDELYKLTGDPRRELLAVTRAVRQYLERKVQSGESTVQLSADFAGKLEAQYGPGSTLEALDRVVSGCTKCRLSESRTQTVFGTGSPRAKLVFIGEAPGKDEDAQGEPFVGAAGQVLTRLINKMGLSRDTVYICNIIKCRPPENREPMEDEEEACRPYLMEQLKFIKPKFICCLGAHAARALLRTSQSVSQLRGKFHLFEGIKVLVTFHPAACIYNPGNKKYVWDDVQKILAEYDKA